MDADMFDSATRDVLMASAKLIGSECVKANLAFSRCKAANADPEACLAEGAAVTECAKGVLERIASTAGVADDFESYRKCLDKKQMRFGLCRKQQQAFEGSFEETKQ